MKRWGCEDAWTRPLGVRVDGPGGPKVLRVLKFDSHCVAEGYGIAAFGGDEYKYRRRRHIILPSEPARSVGRTHRSARSARTIEPGRRRRLNPPAAGNTVPRRI